MNLRPLFVALLLSSLVPAAQAILPPANVVSRTGDQSIVLHWDRSTDPTLAGYRVYRATTNGGPFTLLTGTLLTAPGYCDLSVINGNTNYYYVTAVTTTSVESAPSATLAAMAHLFASDDDFLDYVQETSFDYFWYAANPANGLVPDRSATGSACSIAAVGFGLTAIGIAVDHGWLARTQAVARVLTTLNTFLNGPQGTNVSGMIGYKGWFYHFLDMNSAVRANSELSSIDTTLLLAGMLYAKQYFNGANSDETAIRNTVDIIFNRVDWNWMAQGTDAVSMGWYPTSGFIANNWVGYDEGMILYCFGLGIATNPLPASAWARWTSGYIWGTNWGQSYLQFAPLFGHQYSHCWIDFRHIADSYMNSHSCTYFDNSRRASLAQQAYAAQVPAVHIGYSSNVWGLTASDGPSGYSTHGLPPVGLDDGTIAPTAAGGSMPFTPEISLPTLRYFYSHYRPRIWTAYGFRDAFNLGQAWYDTDELGIDQGPIVIMIENYRTQKVWQLFMQNPEVQRGLQRAGFVSLPLVAPLSVQALAPQNTVSLTWNATNGVTYQVEYSPDLNTWFFPPTGKILATGSTATWTDSGPPGTPALPFSVDQRFYRIYQFGPF